MRSRAASFAFAVAALLLTAAPARAITRAQAVATVINNVILPHPQAGFIRAFGPQSPVSPGTIVYDGFTSTPLFSVPSTSWLFWLDTYPETRFAHATVFVLVNDASGLVTVQTSGSYWPIIGTTTYYRNTNDRASGSPDLIYEGGDIEPGPQSQPARVYLPEPQLLGETYFPDACAIIICGENPGANPDFQADIDTAKAICGVAGVPPGNVKTIINKSPQAVLDSLANAKKKCPKLFVFVIAHGSRGTFSTGGGTVSAADFAGKLNGLMATETCTYLQQCFSGSFLPALRDSGVVGTHSSASSADTTTHARNALSVKFPWMGEINLHYLAHCIRNGKRGQAASACAKDSVAAYVARRRKDGTAPHNPDPQVGVVVRDTTAGQSTLLVPPGGTQTVCVEWPPGPASVCGNVSVYVEVVNGADTTWQLIKIWNWNLGQNRYFSTNVPGGTGRFRLVSHSNGYPVRINVRFLANLMPETPSSALTFAAASLGWRDELPIELWPLTLAGSNQYVPGLRLDHVPRNVGMVGNQPVPLALAVPVQPDPLRPWLYNNHDPAQGFNGRVTVEMPATRIFDPLGNPVPFVQLTLDFYQGPDFRQFTVFAQDAGDHILVPPVDLGLVRPQMFQLVLHTPAGSAKESVAGPGGFVELDAFIVNLETFGTADRPEVPVTALELSAARPNPFSHSTSLQLALPTAQWVRARVVDLAGREVRMLTDRMMGAGQHRIEWDGRDEAARESHAGVYFIVVETESGRESRKMVLVK